MPVFPPCQIPKAPNALNNSICTAPDSLVMSICCQLSVSNILPKVPASKQARTMTTQVELPSSYEPMGRLFLSSNKPHSMQRSRHVSEPRWEFASSGCVIAGLAGTLDCITRLVWLISQSCPNPNLFTGSIMSVGWTRLLFPSVMSTQVRYCRTSTVNPRVKFVALTNAKSDCTRWCPEILRVALIRSRAFPMVVSAAKI